MAQPSNPNPIVGGGGAVVASLTPLQDSVCNHGDAQIALERGLDSNAVAFARVNGYYTWCIPEYDDDQRLSDGSGGPGYGPIAHVLAAPWIDTLRLTASYTQVAIVEVDPDPNHTPPDTYHQLRLDGQFNCLYLRRVAANTASAQLEALIVPPATNLQCPTSPVSPPQPLVVFVDHLSVPGDSVEIPPTTRFVEGNSGRTMIGVKCGARWCVVGPPNSGAPMPLSAHAKDNITPLLTNAQGRVKGWFDDQVLGVPDNTNPLKIHRQYRASAVPNRNLGGLTVVANFLGAPGAQVYQNVGAVYFDSMPDPESKYVQTFGFTQGVNLVGLRAEKQGSKTVWFAQVTNANGHKDNIPTQRMDHGPYLKKLNADGRAYIPATMRWRWFDKDEDLWVECDLGCCLVGSS